MIVENNKVWKTHDQGIATILVAALDPKLERGNGKGVCLSDCQFEDVVEYAKSPEIAERLWGLSEELVLRGREKVEGELGEGEDGDWNEGEKGGEVKL